jgi:excisionase family DNA binding protein
MIESLVMENGCLLKPQEVAERLRISLRKLWQMLAEGKLPLPVHIGKRGTRWRQTDLVSYIAAL